MSKQDEARDEAIDNCFDALDEVLHFMSLEQLIDQYNNHVEDRNHDDYAWSGGFADNH